MADLAQRVFAVFVDTNPPEFVESGEDRECRIIALVFTMLDRRSAGEAAHRFDADHGRAAFEINPVAPILRFVSCFKLLHSEGADNFTNRARFIV